MTSYGANSARPTLPVGSKRLPPLAVPEHPAGEEWSPATVEFWNALTGDPARRGWNATHMKIALLALVAFDRALNAQSPTWSAECRRLQALLPGGIAETDRPVSVPETPVPVLPPRRERRDPRLDRI
jgi:hypothetical protein